VAGASGPANINSPWAGGDYTSPTRCGAASSGVRDSAARGARERLGRWRGVAVPIARIANACDPCFHRDGGADYRPLARDGETSPIRLSRGLATSAGLRAAGPQFHWYDRGARVQNAAGCWRCSAGREVMAFPERQGPIDRAALGRLNTTCGGSSTCLPELASEQAGDPHWLAGCRRGGGFGLVTTRGLRQTAAPYERQSETSRRRRRGISSASQGAGNFGAAKGMEPSGLAASCRRSGADCDVVSSGSRSENPRAVLGFKCGSCQDATLERELSASAMSKSRHGKNQE